MGEGENDTQHWLWQNFTIHDIASNETVEESWFE